MRVSAGSKSIPFHPSLIGFIILFFILLYGSVSYATDLTLAWDPPNQEPGLVYNLCYGTASDTYTACIDTENQTSVTIENLEPGLKYYFAATASNQYGESEYSQEISYTVPIAPTETDGDGDGVTLSQGDCDDGNKSIHPGAVETCGDGIDQDCNGSDLACVELPENIDDDGDGITDAQGDCDDTNPNINPNAGEICGDGVDQNCDGIDPICLEDIDNDGDGFTENRGDCADSDSSIHPGAVEICGDGIDQDCSGSDLACPVVGDLVREAEEGDIVGAFEIVNDAAASGGYYVQVPNTIGTRFDGPDDTHKITYTFNISKAGTYRIKGTVYAANGSDDSFWVQVNGDPTNGYLWDVLQNTSYREDYVNDRDGADPVEVTLPAGVNTVSVYLREDGTRLDRIELEPVTVTVPISDIDGDGIDENEGDCNDNNASVYPGAKEVCGDGIDQDCSGSDLACPVSDDLIREAEEGALFGAFEIGNDAAASGGRYVYVPGWSSRSAPDEAQKVEFTFNVTISGNYRIRAWVYAPDSARDSFLVKVNGSPTDGYIWHVLQNTAYSQDYVRDGVGTDPVEIWLDKKATTVTVYQRESGTRLDRIELEPVTVTIPVSDNDGDGIDENQGDCNDNNASVYPGAAEVCGDGIDQDCDGADLICENAEIDSDGDGLTNHEEIDTYLTDPNKADTDGDGYSDGEEVANGWDPLSPETNIDIGVPKLEIGEVSVDHNWLFVTFSKIYEDPVVVAGAASLNGSDPATVRIRNVTAIGFEIRVQEWEYLNGSHVSESVGYLVMERGQYRLSDGTMIEAGTFTTKTPPAFERVNFQNTFNRQPVVLSAITSANDPDAAVGRLRNVDTDGFEIKLQEQEANPNNHLSEVISFIAWEPSAGNIDGFAFLVDQTGDVVTHKIHTIGLSIDIDKSPVFLCDMQTTDGGNTANLRWLNKDAYGVEVLVDEEQSRDTEINHITEVVGFIGITKTDK